MILAATVRILRSRGLAAVTHRRVAEEADVPLAATTYYFSSKDELVTEALAILVEDEIDRLSRRAAEMGVGLRSPADSAAALADVLFSGDDAAGALLAQFEVYLEAARRPSLRPDGRALASGLHVARRVVADPGGRRGAGRAWRPCWSPGSTGSSSTSSPTGSPDDRDLDRLSARLEQLFAPAARARHRLA